MRKKEEEEEEDNPIFLSWGKKLDREGLDIFFGLRAIWPKVIRPTAISQTKSVGRQSEGRNSQMADAGWIKS